MPAVIVMPAGCSAPQSERTSALGAEIVLYDRAREEPPGQSRRRIADKRHARGCRPMTMRLSLAGQARPAARFVERSLGGRLVPVHHRVTASGGGLTAGIALAVRRECRRAPLHRGPDGFDSMPVLQKRTTDKERQRSPATIFYALMARRPRNDLRDHRVTGRRRASVSDEEVVRRGRLRLSRAQAGGGPAARPRSRVLSGNDRVRERSRVASSTAATSIRSFLPGWWPY